MNFKLPKTGPLRESFKFRSLMVMGLLSTLIVLSSAGCARHKEDPRYKILETPQYKNWEFYTYKNIKIFHQPHHLQQDNFESMAKMYLRSIAKISEVLNMPPYTDTLIVVYYTGFGQGREMTGREYPFAKDGIIYFWLPSFLGPTLMQYMLPRWLPVEPKYQFLKHGLITLFDFSGQNYHRSTYMFVKEGKFIPLEELAADTAVNSNTERYQSAEAASFVAYILADHGVNMLKNMYQSELPFDKMVQDFFFMPVDSLQQKWLDYAEQNVPPDTTGQQK
jgi:hypothetical protein